MEIFAFDNIDKLVELLEALAHNRVVPVYDKRKPAISGIFAITRIETGEREASPSKQRD
jgi:hypothetical protein